MGLEIRSISMNDREEIRRRLAAESEPQLNIKSRIGVRKCFGKKTDSDDLQMCFLNETPDSPIVDGIDGLKKMRNEAFDRIKQNNNCDSSGNLYEAINDMRLNNRNSRDLMVHLRKNKMERFRFILETARPNRLIPEDFSRYHSLIVAEAKLALAQAKEMAKVQMMLERENYRSSKIAELISIDKNQKLDDKLLKRMNFSKLQLLVNDLHGRIKALNEELVHLLQERDELHMEQDSILVDIEDATIFLLKRLTHQSRRRQQSVDI